MLAEKALASDRSLLPCEVFQQNTARRLPPGRPIASLLATTALGRRWLDRQRFKIAMQNVSGEKGVAIHHCSVTVLRESKREETEEEKRKYESISKLSKRLLPNV